MMDDIPGLRSLAQDWALLQESSLYLPRDNPTFANPLFDSASLRMLIVRLSTFQDVERSTPHLVLFQAARRALPEGYIDMAFLPPGRDREALEASGLPPLAGIQSHCPPEDFDLVLISNAYTLELVNLPYLLLRSGVPLMASQRDERWPPLILGGSNDMTTQAIVTEEADSMVDALFFGEGEGQIGSLIRSLEADRELHKRERLLRAASRVEGLWVTGQWPERSVRKAVLHNPGARDLLVDYPLLNGQEAQTARLQINFGCPAFCTFCFEGYDRKPYREVSLSAIRETASRLKQAHGCQTLELYSFNFNIHSDIFALLLELNRLFHRVGATSQRIDVLNCTPQLIEAEVAADKRHFTLGVEGISQRQRTWLHKSLSSDMIFGVLERLLQQKIRQIKLFYLFTGHEQDADIDEFREFVAQLKALRRRYNPGIRVTFSFGLLVRMPFTPLRYDRLFLDPDEWRQIIGPVKSACETNGFEFRLATEWDEYCTSQVLAMGGYWMHEPLAMLAARGHCYDQTLSPGYWDALREWLEAHGRWTPELLGEKSADASFPLEFVETNVSSEFLYRQYLQARAGVDEGYCLGDGASDARCLACGACPDGDQRSALLGHRIRPPQHGYFAQLEEMMRSKWRLAPVYAKLRLPATVAGTGAEWLGAWVLRSLLGAYPELTEKLLAARESLFTVGENQERFGCVIGETVFALTGWNAEGALNTLLATPRRVLPGLELLSVAEGFVPGEFDRATFSFALSQDHFPDAGRQLVEFLRASYVPCNLRRAGNGYLLDLPERSLKKRVVLGGEFEEGEAQVGFRIIVGPKFDLVGFLRSFPGPDRSLQVPMAVSDLNW